MMYIGCNTLYPRGPLALDTDFTLAVTCEALDKLQAVGYQATEYSHCEHWTLDEARAIGAYAREHGISSWSCHAWTQPSSAMNPRELADQLSRCVEICAALGGRVVVIHTPLQLGLKLDERFPIADLLVFDLAALRPAQQKGEALGVELALENGHALEHMQYVLELVAALGAANVGFCVDTGHANLGTLGAARAIRLAGEKLYTTHLQDNLGERDDHLPPGRGAIDWAAVFTALREVRYARPLILELTDRVNHRPYDQDLELRQGLANTQAFATRSGLGA